MIQSIALYLPQFHPIPENDEWWGKGFTEWTNVTKAKPLFKGHFQPRLPADLGFYDLRLPEAREAQAAIARQYGITAFCYWHYWFAGRRVIERPFTDMVQQQQPNFPFCIAWANQTWSGTWHGLSNKKILIEQTYPGRDDDTAHFYTLQNAFADKRYMKVNGKNLVFIFRPMDIPEPKAFTETWQQLAIKEGLPAFHFVGMHMPPDWDFAAHGFQAMVEMGPQLHKLKEASFIDKAADKLLKLDFQGLKQKKLKMPRVIAYKNYTDRYPDHATNSHEYPMVYPGWDNTPRSGADGWLFENATPALFYDLCMKAFNETASKPDGEQIVILKSWNEWAEGNYLEPDREFGHQYLEAFRKAQQDYTALTVRNIQ